MLAVVTTALLTTGCGAVPGWQRAPEQVVIGVDLNLTGRGNELGTVFHDALRLQLERLNDRQPLGDERRLRLEVRDNRGDPASAAGNLTDLLADPDVSAIITAGCPDCVVQLAPDLTTPVVSLDAAASVSAPASERRWAFQIGPDAAASADALSAAMAQAGVRTVGLIAAGTPYGDEGLAAVAEAAGRDGLTIVERQRVAAEQANTATTAAARVAGWQPVIDPFAPAPDPPAGPDAVVVWVPAPGAAGVTDALRGAGYSGPLYLDMLAADELFFRQAPGRAALVFTPTLVVDTLIAASPALSERRRWFADYLSRYGTYHAQASFAADALLVLADALRRAGSLDRAVIRDKLESTLIDGITGQIRFTGDQHSGLHPSSLTILTASDGRWR
jgi:branched-chain amino acid transport system substrate-binding protein